MSITRFCGSSLRSQIMRLGFSAAHQQQSRGAAGAAGPVYELRIYSVKPDKFGDFLKLMSEQFHLRLNYTMPLGYWIADLGGIFQAVHIWPYDSVSQRAAVRGAMGKDAEWQSKFFSKFLTYVMKLDNSLLVPAPGSQICTDFKPSPTAVYELLSLPVGDSRELSTTPASQNETLVGRFHSVYGETATEYRVLRYPDADTALVHARDRSATMNKIRGYSRFMVPHECSPIK